MGVGGGEFAWGWWLGGLGWGLPRRGVHVVWVLGLGSRGTGALHEWGFGSRQCVLPRPAGTAEASPPHRKYSASVMPV